MFWSHVIKISKPARSAALESIAQPFARLSGRRGWRGCGARRVECCDQRESSPPRRRCAFGKAQDASDAHKRQVIENLFGDLFGSIAILRVVDDGMCRDSRSFETQAPDNLSGTLSTSSH